MDEIKTIFDEFDIKTSHARHATIRKDGFVTFATMGHRSDIEKIDLKIFMTLSLLITLRISFDYPEKREKLIKVISAL